ncbi:uncharacterized protein [Onthophagus taurus]|uniref:uncharacterized protein n=1 Tax=Onthophagus taurus TaxID=166361 RepID=UPI0039BE42F6
MSDKLSKTILQRHLPHTRLLETFKLGKTIEDEDQRSIFLARAEEIEGIYSQFQTLHNQIIGLIEETDYEEQDKVRKEADTAYFSIKALIRAWKSSSAQSSPKLHKITLPTFSGNYKEWPTYFDLFNSLIHDNLAMTPIVKFQYLLTSLKGEAFSLLKGLPMTTANYIVAYNTLKGRYQNKRYLATLYFHEIIHLKSLKDESAKSVRHLTDFFNENVEGFRQLGFPVKEWDFLLLNLLLQKLTDSLRASFEDEHASIEILTYIQLTPFLEKKAKALEAVLLNNATEKPSFGRFKPHAREKLVTLKTESSSSGNETRPCLLCSETHPIY